MRRFEAAPWPTGVRVVSALATVGLAGMTYALARALPHGASVPFAETFGVALTFVPPLILCFALLFVVTGYEVGPRELVIRRLLWGTRISLAGLDAAWPDPSAMCRSIRLFGNGGLYAITGLFRSRRLGVYRAFVTDPKRSVVLRLPGRTLIVSPESPERFAGYLASLFPALRTTPDEEPRPAR